MNLEFKIFTLNCWGIPVVSKNRKERMQAIAEVLAVSNYDIVCLQEVWTDTDFNLICGKIGGSFPFSHYFYSGVVGSGVCVFSKYVLQDVFFHQWPVNGYVHKLQHGDWFGGKGVGLCRIRVNDYNINIYSAHLHAEYNRNCDEYQAHRVLQAFDTAQFIQLTSANADLVILAGDLNTEPGDLAYRILVNMTGLIDAFTEADAIAQETSSTNEDLHNSYTASSLIKKQCPGKRIDYIMYFGGPSVQVDMKQYKHPLPNRVPNCNFSYSDHEAITAILKISHSEVPVRIFDASACANVLKESINVCDKAVKRLINHKRVYWFLTAILFMLLITTVATEAPFGQIVLYHVIRVIITVIMGFTFIMATLWNMIESNAVIAGKLAMEVSLKQFSGKQS